MDTAREFQIAPLRVDGTQRSWVQIWVVRVEDDLFVRSYTGPGGRWYRAALKTGKGLIKADGVEKDVDIFEEADPGLNKKIDDAYIAKYGRFPEYVAPMVSPEVQATTLKLLPR